MTEEDWRWFEMGKKARQLSPPDIKLLEDQLRVDQSNMDVRVQLFAYYNEYKGNKLRHDNAEQKLSELVLWFIRHKPFLDGHMGHQLRTTGHCFGPKSFAMLREAWLEQVAAAPMDGIIMGNAASFIAWNDLETASGLFERAQELQPNKGWLGIYVIHCHTELQGTSLPCKDQLRRQIIDAGMRSLKSEPGGAPFLTAEYVSDAALSLGRYELVHWCAQFLRDWNVPALEQMANAYLGLVALREENRELAIQLMLEMKRGYEPQSVVFRLARELFDVGEREPIIQLIKSFKRKLKTPVRNRWLQQIANNQPPDFDDYCC